jgi:hypothetical protein
MRSLQTRPEIQFVPLSTDARTIRFFGTLMPAVLLLRASPLRFVEASVAACRRPRTSAAEFVASGSDDAARLDDALVFIHRWQSDSFDPLAFAQARAFLAQLTRLLKWEGYAADPLDPLSPEINLPRLAAGAGLGSLSPYGLLVHPSFGPRLIITAVRTDCPLRAAARWQGSGCTDCLACLQACPQRPYETGVIALGRCQSCAVCLTVCPVGTARAPTPNRRLAGDDGGRVCLEGYDGSNA